MEIYLSNRTKTDVSGHTWLHAKHMDSCQDPKEANDEDM